MERTDRAGILPSVGQPGGLGPIRRIAILSVHTCPLAVLGGKKTGGMNVYVREIAREFSRRGIKVDVFTRSQDPCEPHIQEGLGLNARVIHIPTGPEIALNPEDVYPYLPQFVENVKAFARLEGAHYDLIYSHYWLSGVAAHELREAWGAPVVQMFHTLGRMKDRIANKPQQYNTRDLNETDIMSWADALIAATPAERAQMLWLYHARRHQIEIIPPGVDLTHFEPRPIARARAQVGLAPDQKMLLFVGRIEPLKAVDTIFDALSLLKTSRPALLDRLVVNIVGGDPNDLSAENGEMERLKALRANLGLEQVVAFLGAKDQTSLTGYYSAAEALIMPSDYESFGMVALEAMACGTPVIASEVGGLAFLVSDGANGYHVPVREPGALAERIERLLTTPGERDRLAAGAIETAQAYSWEAIADRLLKVFEGVIEKKRAAMQG
jgi:D-inositol-3-phosphate glycosyltransferase